MNESQSHAFSHLLSVWNRHQDRRQAQAPVADLFQSRVSLAQARATMHHHLN